jgi:hypothetical protein
MHLNQRIIAMQNCDVLLSNWTHVKMSYLYERHVTSSDIYLTL